MCLSGPVLRATGVPYDVRRAHPYSVYELEFDIPTRTEGDSYARYLLHLDEVQQSLHSSTSACTKCLTDQSWPRSRGSSASPGRAFVAIESPRGQYPTYGISDGSDQPFRLRIHDPSFFNLAAMNGAAARQPDRRHDGQSSPASTRSRAASISRNGNSMSALTPLVAPIASRQDRPAAAVRRRPADGGDMG